MNRVRLSTGETITRKEFDRRIINSKKLYTQLFVDKYGYVFCERCKHNECTFISRSHIISVKQCIETQRAELAYDLNNYEHLGIEHHRDIEDWSNDKREAWYHARKEKISYNQFIKTYGENNH